NFANESECVSLKGLKLPQVKIESFKGDENDSLKFHNFITTFQDVIGHRRNLAKSAKLTYLRGYLSAYALKLVEHLSVCDESYDTALALLKKEFLNKDAVVAQLCNRLLNIKCKTDKKFTEVRLFLSEIRSLLSDLKKYGVEILEEKAGCVIVSNCVFNRLPDVFRQEMARKIGNNYPKLNEIFEHY
ncbi:Protein of unknown function DUF1759, partial [Trinorchestia longiramus]